MNTKKSKWILSSLVSVSLLTSLAIGADSKFCQQYAKRAVSQFNQAKANKLPGINPPVWSNNYQGHKFWCELPTITKAIANDGTAMRQKHLDTYLKANLSKNVKPRGFQTVTIPTQVPADSPLPIPKPTPSMGGMSGQTTHTNSKQRHRAPAATPVPIPKPIRVPVAATPVPIPKPIRVPVAATPVPIPKPIPTIMPVVLQESQPMVSSKFVKPHTTVRPPVKISDSMLTRITNKQPFSIGNNLERGSTVYGDTNFMYWNMPSELDKSEKSEKLDYFITNNSDKFSTNDEFIRFTHPSELTVYVAFDVRIKNIPAWVDREHFTNMYQTLSVKVPDNSQFITYNIYKKTFPGGEIILGGNLNNKGDETNANMYLVIADIKGASPDILFSGETIKGIARMKVLRGAAQDPQITTSSSETKRATDPKENKVCVTKKQKLNARSNSLFFLGDSRESVFFPGNILNISNIEKGDFSSAYTAKRNPYVISTNIAGTIHTSAMRVSTPTLDAYRQAKGNLLRPSNIGNIPNARVTYGTMKSVESEADFYVKVTGSVSSLIHSGGASFSYNRTNKKNRFVVEIEKIYYDIDYSPNSNGFFADPNIPLSSDWVYVSKVRYGSKAILLVESDYELIDVEAAVKYGYNGIIVSGGATVETRNKKILRNSNIQAIAIGGNTPQAIAGMIRNPGNSTFADAFENSKITPTTPLYPLAYTLRHIKDGSEAVLQTYAEYDQQICGKIKDVIKIHFKEIVVLKNDDKDSGEEIYGWLEFTAPQYGKKVVFDYSSKNHIHSMGSGVSKLIDNGIYYLPYNKDIDDFIEIKAHLKEKDSLTNSNDDFGHAEQQLSIKDIVAGAVDSKYLETEVFDGINQNPCEECYALPFRHEGSRVIIRYTIETLDKMPANIQ